MACDDELAARVRQFLTGQQGITERKMFGGVAFLLHGNMCCGVVNDDLMVRVGAENDDESLALPHARPMDFTGRPMKGFVFVGSKGIGADDALEHWINRGVTLARTLPKK